MQTNRTFHLFYTRTFCLYKECLFNFFRT